MVRLVRQHFWGLLLLVVLLVGSSVAVSAWKAGHPGAMSVLEAQAMDMTVMKPPVGSVPVETEIVHSGPFAAKVTYTGSVAPLEEQVVYPRVEGYLKSLTVYSGDRVASGQLIATVDSPDLQSKVAEAAAGSAAAATEIPTAKYAAARAAADSAASKGEIEAAKSDLARAKSLVSASEKAITQREQDVKSAKANLDYWQAQIVREKKLLDDGAISLQEYQSQKAQATAAEAELGNKQATLEEVKADVEAARADAAGKRTMLSVARQRASAASAAVSEAGSAIKQKTAAARQAGAALATAAAVDQYRSVRAPFSGTLTRRYVSPGQFVTPNTAVVDVVQIDKVRLQANVSDADLASIRLGATVTARFVKDPKLIINARVTSISPLADQASRTAVVEAVVPNPGHKLLPGDAVTLQIAAESSAHGLTVPAAAIVQKDQMSAVWVARQEINKGKTIYYCPMHPEVTSSKPGKCPKCGMGLVPNVSLGNKKAHLVMVTTEATDGDRIEVMSGLRDGDEVIYLGNTYLREGDTVSTGGRQQAVGNSKPMAGMEMK